LRVRREVTASDVDSPPESFSASLKISVLSRLGAAISSGGGAGSPLNFCQSPVLRRSAATGSLGCAPTLSQCRARSLSTTITDGSAFGWYLPISSMTRPSRLVRESATTMR
jgi:hypothetical protein